VSPKIYIFDVSFSWPALYRPREQSVSDNVTNERNERERERGGEREREGNNGSPLIDRAK